MTAYNGPSAPAMLNEAAREIAPLVHRTPLLTSRYLNERTGCQLWFKAENFQKTGSFKARGAAFSVGRLSARERQRGVATHSSGNHGQALAWAARQWQCPATVVMPENAPKVKVAAVKAYGAEVEFCAPTQAAREELLQKICAGRGAHFIPPFNYEPTIAGQSTAAREILEEVTPDIILTPVGGGGLLAGSALAAAALNPDVSVMGAEPAAADDAQRSFRSGRLEPVQQPDTIADGLRTSLGPIPFGYIRQHVSDILTCSEEDIIRAMRLIWERMKVVVEPSGAVPLAVVLSHPESFAGRQVALILSGGNVDLSRLPF